MADAAPPSAPPAPAPAPAPSAAARGPRAARLAAALLVAALAGAAGLAVAAGLSWREHKLLRASRAALALSLVEQVRAAEREQRLRDLPGLIEAARAAQDSEELRRAAGVDWSEAALGERASAHGARVLAAAFSPDGKLLATASADTTLALWDRATGREVNRMGGVGANALGRLVFSGDGRLLASVHEGGHLWFWEVATGRAMARLKLPADPPRSVALAPDGRTAAVGHASGRVSLIRLGDGSAPPQSLAVQPFAAEHATGARVAFAPDGKRLAAALGSATGEASLWLLDANTLEPALLARGRGLDWPVFLAGGALLTGGGDRLVLWDPAARARTAELVEPGLEVAALAASADGQIAAAGSAHLVVWDLAARARLGALQLPAPLTALALAPDGAELAAGLRAGFFLRAGLRRFAGHPAPLRALACAPGAGPLASGAADGSVILWDAATGAEQRRIATPPPLLELALSRDGQVLAAAAGDGSIGLYRPSDGALLGRLAGHAGGARSLAFAPDGAALYSSGADKRLRVWDVASRAQRGSEELPDADSLLAVSPDGQTLALRLGFGIVAEDLPSLHARVRLSLDGAGLAYSPDSATLAAGLRPGQIELLEARALQPGRRIPPDGVTPDALAFSEDGALVGKLGPDGVLRLFAARGGAPVAALAVAEEPPERGLTACGGAFWVAGPRRPLRVRIGGGAGSREIGAQPRP